MKIKKLNLLYLLFFIIFTGCLPEEKTTQCGENEAFDSTQRKCVASLGVTGNTLNIATVSPASSYTVSPTDPSKTHTVTVSDPYSNGHQLRWYLTHPGSSTLLLSTAASVTFNHTSYTAGSYIMEVQLLDSTGVTVVDSRSWTVNIINDQTPSINQVTAPAFSTTTTSTNTLIMATAVNPDSINFVNYQWYVNGNPILGESGSFSGTSQPLSFSFNPTASSSYYNGPGIYSVSLQLTENLSGSLYNLADWTISNNLPDFANVSLAMSGFGNITPSTATPIVVIDEVAISTNGFLSDVDGDNNLDSIDFCISVDDVTGVNSNGVFVDFQIDGVNIPLASNRQLAINGQSYCLSGYNDYSYNIPDIIASESHTLSATVYDKFPASGSGNPNYNGYSQLASFSWTLRVRQKNTAPEIEINVADSTDLSCASTTTTSASGCTITQDTSFDLAIEVTDEDYDAEDYATDFAKFRVEFFLDGVLIDGSHSLSSSDCFEDFSETASAARYICSLTINSYDVNGPINGPDETYTLTARVLDEDSPYIAVSSEESNSISWQISTVNNSDTAIELRPFANNTLNSFIDNTTRATTSVEVNNLTGTAVATEGETVVFQVRARDTERDSHTIKVERCLDAVCTTAIAPALHSVVVNSTSDDETKLTSISHVIEEDEVTLQTGTVFYRVSVTDIPGGNLDSEIVAIRVDNNNPDPTFDTTPTPAFTDSLIAITGFPLTLDPGSISDSSTADGDNILYQWVIDPANDGNYQPIPGATERVLIWTPGSDLNFTTQTGQIVKLKLCVGDDGIVDSSGNLKDPLDGLDCNADAVSSTPWINITVFSNSSFGDYSATANSGGVMASWLDPSTLPSEATQYIAYTDTTHNNIIIEKISVNGDGTKSGSSLGGTNTFSSIVVDSTDLVPSSGNPVISDISMAGDTVNDQLYVSYQATVETAPGVFINHTTIMRIDISERLIITSGADVSAITMNSDGNPSFDFTTTTPDATIIFQNIIDGGDGDGAADLDGDVEIVMGTDFCNPIATCPSATDAAIAFVTYFNGTAPEMDDKILQGYYASRVGTEVSFIPNKTEGDFNASKLGDIEVYQADPTLATTYDGSSKVILPMINENYPGSEQFKVSVLSSPILLSPSRNTYLNTKIGSSNPSQEIASDMALLPDGLTTLITVATKGLDNEIYMHAFDPVSYAISDDEQLFVINPNGLTLNDIKLSVGKTANNSSIYLTGMYQDIGTSEYNISFARIDVDTSTNDNYDFQIK